MRKLGKVLILSSSILAGASTISITPLSSMKVEASSTATFNKTYYQTTSKLNLRSGAGTKYKTILSIPKGAVVTSTEKKGTWFKVSYSYKSKEKKVSKTGWVSGSYLKEYNQYVTISKSYYFTNKKTKLYSTPDTKKKEVATIASNNGFYSTQKIINSAGQTWYRISYDGKTRYANGSNVSQKSFSTFSQTSYKSIKETYLYEFYGKAHKKLMSIPKDTIISSNKNIGDWYLVKYNGKLGYIFIGDFSKNTNTDETSYTYTDTSETFYVTTSASDLYTTAGSTKGKVNTVAANNIFASTQEVKNSLGETWYRISYNGQDLYINSETVNKTSFSDSVVKIKASKETNLYESHGEIYAKLATIPKDTVVTSTKRIGDWYYVSFNETPGYINIGDFSKYSDVSQETIADTTFATLSMVNLYKEASDTSELIDTIPSSKIVVATAKTSNGWYQVSYLDKTGYVPMNSLQQVKTGDPLNGRAGYQFIDLRTPSPVTAKQIDDYIAENYKNQPNYKKTGRESVLLGTGQLFINAGETYGVNPLYLAAHAIHESGFGTSDIALGKNNLFGFGSFDSNPFIASYRFSTIEENINYIAQQIKATYLNEVSGGFRYKGAFLGFKTTDMNNKRIDANSEGMNFYYASDINWGKGIARHMQNILPYDQAYYSNAPVDKSVISTPSIPQGSDIFPNGTQAIAKKDLVLNSSKGSKDAVLALKQGSTFTVLEKTNDYWISLVYNNTNYWTNSIDFVKYKDYISVQNLGRVKNTNSLNVRKDPTTSNGDSNIITTLQLNDYVRLVLNADGTLVMDSSDKWYQIQLADGTNAWVSAAYIARELY